MKRADTSNSSSIGSRTPDFQDEDNQETKKIKRSRWSASADKEMVVLGMPTSLPADVDWKTADIYLLQLHIEEISGRLRTGNLGIPESQRERSPSPEPIYNSEGRRLNTREVRVRKKLEEKRHELIQRMLSLNPTYKPPGDYKSVLQKLTDKIFLLQDYPDINFVGLLIGPRGNTLRQIEKETNCKVVIRGKGSARPGKSRPLSALVPGEGEELHVYLEANSAESLASGVKQIRKIVQEAIDNPIGDNDLRRQQMRELALLHGTLRENGSLKKLRELANAETVVTNQIVCARCGGRGHIENDCVQSKSALLAIEYNPQKEMLDTEYASLMTELGQVVPEHLRHEIAEQQRLASVNAGKAGEGASGDDSATQPGNKQYSAGYGAPERLGARKEVYAANPQLAEIKRQIQQNIRTAVAHRPSIAGKTSQAEFPFSHNSEGGYCSLPRNAKAATVPPPPCYQGYYGQSYCPSAYNAQTGYLNLPQTWSGAAYATSTSSHSSPLVRLFNMPHRPIVPPPPPPPPPLQPTRRI